MARVTVPQFGSSIDATFWAHFNLLNDRRVARCTGTGCDYDYTCPKHAALFTVAQNLFKRQKRKAKQS